MTDNQTTKKPFDLVSKYSPTGDQPTAIEQLSTGIDTGTKEQILLGATGTGKPIRFQTSSLMQTNQC
ncbi:excinuclease ABC subunit B [Weissella viridescens]|uniref:Excinuclease ABC subunit B n=1 Tax=Weissella viridescens TaxID=1629 RepID=A0A380P249_WEIVI|nr:excinuclease ABC subunit B [Weissella viridescens]